MSTEEAIVEVRVRGEDVQLWLDVRVNGRNLDYSLPVDSTKHADKIAADIERVIKSAYRSGYRQGYSSCQRVVKDALGLPK